MRLSCESYALLNHVKNAAAATFSRKQMNEMRKMWKSLPSMKLGLVDTVTSIRSLSKQFSTPSLDANSIQSCVGDGLQFDSASHFNAATKQPTHKRSLCHGFHA